MPEGESADEILDGMVEQPKEEVEFLPEWEEFPEEQPGENTRVEDDVLKWERDGFEVELESYEVTHWKVDLDIPEDVAKWYPREMDLKCLPLPEYGYVESVELNSYEATGATLIIQDNFQPTFEVNKFIDHLLNNAEESEEFMNEINEEIESARGD